MMPPLRLPTRVAMESLRYFLQVHIPILLLVLLAYAARTAGQPSPALRSALEARHASPSTTQADAAAAPPTSIATASTSPGPWAFQCALQGWEKASCLQLDGCAWCDTDEYGGACVTEAFAERLTKWSDAFHCLQQMMVLLPPSS